MANGWAVKVNGALLVGTIGTTPRTAKLSFVMMSTGLAVYVDELSEDALQTVFEAAGKGRAEVVRVEIRERDGDA